MPEATLRLVAKMAGVAPVTVSRVVNGSENVAPATREKVLAIIKGLNYSPNIHAANLRRKRLNDDSTSATNDRLVDARKLPSAGFESKVKAVCPSEEAFIFSPEERRALAEQIIRLGRDLDRLRKHSESVQTWVNLLQRACSRRVCSRSSS